MSSGIPKALRGCEEVMHLARAPIQADENTILGEKVEITI